MDFNVQFYKPLYTLYLIILLDNSRQNAMQLSEMNYTMMTQIPKMPPAGEHLTNVASVTVPETGTRTSDQGTIT